DREGAVDMKPEFCFCGQIGQLIEWIDRAGVGGAGIRDNANWAQTFRAIFTDGRARILNRQSKIIVASELAHLHWRKSDDTQCSFNRRMRLIREVNGRALDPV